MQERPIATLLGLVAATSPDVVREAVDRFKSFAREEYARDPMEATLRAVVASSLAFYAAERGKNPKVRTFHDALVFVTTSLSVGFCDIYAMTPVGKSIASALQIWGPGMAAGIFDPPAAERPTDSSPVIVDRLDKILAALEARTAI